MIKDCFGNVAQIGDQIAFSMGNAGAKGWLHAVITRITAKSVYFEGRPGDNWRWKETTELRRGEGSFVINIAGRSN